MPTLRRRSEGSLSCCRLNLCSRRAAPPGSMPSGTGILHPSGVVSGGGLEAGDLSVFLVVADDEVGACDDE